MTVEQHFAKSKDGTRVPYFLVLPNGFEADGTTPTLMYGYGGYQISRLEHSLQSATRARLDGAGVDWVVAALLHDIGMVGIPKSIINKRRTEMINDESQEANFLKGLHLSLNS